MIKGTFYLFRQCHVRLIVYAAAVAMAIIRTPPVI